MAAPRILAGLAVAWTSAWFRRRTCHQPTPGRLNGNAADARSGWVEALRAMSPACVSGAGRRHHSFVTCGEEVDPCGIQRSVPVDRGETEQFCFLCLAITSSPQHPRLISRARCGARAQLVLDVVDVAQCSDADLMLLQGRGAAQLVRHRCRPAIRVRQSCLEGGEVRREARHCGAMHLIPRHECENNYPFVIMEP